MIFKRFNTVNTILCSNKIRTKSGFPMFLTPSANETNSAFSYYMYDLFHNRHNLIIHSITVFEKYLYLHRFNDKLNTVKCRIK